MKPIVVCEAIPFGYGPAAILNSLLSELSENYHIVVCSSGSTYDFFQKTDYETLYCDSYDVSAISEFLLHYPNPISAVLSVENERFLFAAKPLGLKTVYVDLFEFIWDTTDSYMPFADKYVVYTLFESNPTLAALRNKSATFIRPAVPTFLQNESGEGILLHVGGLNSKYIHDDLLEDYAAYVSGFVRRLPSFFPSERITVVTSSCFAGPLCRHFMDGPDVMMNADVPYADFLSLLGGCRRFITTPGIHSVLLGAHAKKQLFILYPANYTQYVQLMGFSRLYGQTLLPSDDWIDVGSIKEADGIEMVRQRIAGLRDSAVLDRHVKDVLTNSLCTPPENRVMNHQELPGIGDVFRLLLPDVQSK